jgi:hypothetical protein
LLGAEELGTEEGILDEVLRTDDSVEFTGIEDGAELDTGPVTSPDEEGGVSMIERLSVPVRDPVIVELSQVIGTLDGLSLELDDSGEDVGGLEDSSDEVVGLDALTLLLGMPEIVAEELSVLLDGEPPPVLGNPVELMLEDELSGTDEEADDSQGRGRMIQAPVPLGTDGVVKLKLPNSTTDDVSRPGPEIRGLGLSQTIADELGQDGVVTSVTVIVLEAVTVT